MANNDLDFACDNFNWDYISSELVEILIIIIEKKLEGKKAVFDELFSPINDSPLQAEELRISVLQKLNLLNKLNLLYTEYGSDGKIKDFHYSKNLKKILYTKFPDEVKEYNEYCTKIEVNIEYKTDKNLLIEGAFKNEKFFKLKRNTHYKIKIIEDKKTLFIELEENK
ncbi:MAG: hypothetical protein K2P85_00620 [Flavobacteriaceae bacterium]|nr:hypothetical protein [Flavobacteriaceae bacterium]